MGAQAGLLGKAACLSLSAEEWDAPAAGKGLGLGGGCLKVAAHQDKGPPGPRRV